MLLELCCMELRYDPGGSRHGGCIYNNGAIQHVDVLLPVSIHDSSLTDASIMKIKRTGRGTGNTLPASKASGIQS